jgi:rhamnopyranosyl-N-acetylglucosaminyl-diphospho-decaprenol beta-1,3/1,4-galactofuranosyltransferase
MASDTAQDRIAAVVVTYNRKALLVECLESLISQSHPLDAIYVIDNFSNDGTHESLLQRGLAGPAEGPQGGSWESVMAIGSPVASSRRTHVHFVRLSENTGGAGGFHEGMKRATQAGFDWLWLMDDDLITAPDALKVLVRAREALAPAHGRSLFLNCVVLSKDRRDGDTLAFPLQELAKNGDPRIGVYHWRLSDVQSKVEEGLYRWACPFNGTFISSEAVASIGLPNREFYIKGDEKDFLWRAARKVPVFTVVGSRAFHPEPCRDAFDWKQYYGIRNMFVINKYFHFTIIRDIRLIVRSLAKGLRHGRKGTLLVLRAIRDGLAGRLGRRDDVRTWLNGL